VAERAISNRFRGRALWGLALAVLLGVVFWLQKPPDAVEPSAASHADRAPAAEPSKQPLAARERASDGVPIMPAGANTKVPDEPLHPHPITPAHERIYRENNLVGALNLAVDLEDPRRIRQTLEQYRAEYPEDAHRLQEGYAIIAACLEQLDDATRERAQRFWSTQIRSQTRRYVRRHCLEKVL
jgi:hypothetical protein